MNVIRVTLFLFLIVIHGVSWATNYWVLGSYARTATAIEAAEQLAPITGVAIRVYEFERDGGIFHRLVIDEALLNPSMRSTLETRAITPWLMTTTETQLLSLSKIGGSAEIQHQPDLQVSSEASTESDWYQLVVERLSSVEEALAAERRLSEVFLRVEGKSMLRNGKISHLVLVGPVSADDLTMTEKSLTALGYYSPERIRVEAPLDTQDLSFSSPLSAQTPASMPDTVGTQAVERVPTDDEFNLARLPKKKHSFSNP